MNIRIYTYLERAREKEKERKQTRKSDRDRVRLESRNFLVGRQQFHELNHKIGL